MQADSHKVQAIQQWPIPSNLKELRGFLGLAGYYRRFIQGFGKLAKPLTDLLKKNSFVWTGQATAAFSALKVAMSSPLVLALPDFSQTFEVETNASSDGIGAVLSQKGRPLAYFSQALATKHKGLSVYEREMLAIVSAVQKWRPYLLGRHFVIKTDHQSLKYLIEQRVSTPMQQKWVAKLMGYDYELHYRKGVDNVIADALSRQPSVSTAILAPVSVIRSALLAEIQQSCVQDHLLQGIIQQLQAPANDPRHVHYTYQHQQLRRKGNLVVGNDPDLRLKLIRLWHDTPIGGHSGVQVTYKKLKELVYWKNMQRDVEQYVASCDVCQRHKGENVAYPGLLQSLSIPERVWSDISMDFVEGLPQSHGKDAVLVVVDRLSKYAHFIALKHPYTALSVAQVFLDNIYRLHGLPQTIVSDRDATFISHLWKELFHLLKVQLCLSTAYHPQSDGQTGVVNRCLENYLRCMCSDHPKQWCFWLPLARFWYNTNFHSAVRSTPYEVVYGQSPPLHIPYMPGNSTVDSVDRSLAA